jgi:ankyrin repeat protein
MTKENIPQKLVDNLLIAALEQKNYEAVIQALKNGANIHIKLLVSRPILSFLFSKEITNNVNRLKAINKVLAQIENKFEYFLIQDERGFNILHHAVLNQDFEAISIILFHLQDLAQEIKVINQDDNRNYTPLDLAEAAGLKEITEILKAKIKPYGENNLHLASMNNNLEKVNRILSTLKVGQVHQLINQPLFHESNSFYLACAMKFQEIVQAYLNKLDYPYKSMICLSLNDDRASTIHLLALNGSTEIANLIFTALKNGPDKTPETSKKLVDNLILHQSKKNSTAAFIALENKNFDFFKFLLRNISPERKKFFICKLKHKVKL